MSVITDRDAHSIARLVLNAAIDNVSDSELEEVAGWLDVVLEEDDHEEIFSLMYNAVEGL